MSKEVERLSDPGLPEHVYRKADHDPVAEKKAERQVSILFLLSALGTVGLVAAYVGIPSDKFIFVPILGTTNSQQLFLGLGLAASTLFIGLGAVHWAKVLMPDHEEVAQRHELRSPTEDRADFVASFKERGAQSGLPRRSLIKRTLGLALGLVSVSPLIFLRDLGPLPEKELEKTSWKTGTRLVTDPGDRPIKASDLEIGAVAQVLPELIPDEHRTLSNIAKDAVLLIRIRAEEFKLSPERLAMTHEGIIAFSKICTHMGCAVALYEQQTKHLLCPCHQSTFDVPQAAKVIFGPAARPLPQLDITVDADGYLIARKPFSEPVGPSFWERS